MPAADAARGEARRGRLESRWATVAGLRLHVRASVDAPPPGRPPVVLVHGLVVSSRYFIPTAERLAPDHRVWAPDLPGFGRSDKPARALDVPGLADALAAWMGAVGLGPAALVANSLGCQVAVDLAARRPDLVARVALLGPTVDPRARTARQQLWRFLLDLTREPPAQAHWYLADIAEAGPRRAWVTFRHALRDRIESKAPLVGAPALVVRGERDPIAPRRWAAELAGLLPRGGLAEVAGGAHTVHRSHPDAFVRLLRPFLEASTEASPTPPRPDRAGP